MVYEFHQTLMGKKFYEGTMQSIARSLEKLTRETVEDVVPEEHLSSCLAKGWHFKGSYQADGRTFIVIEKPKEV